MTKTLDKFKVNQIPMTSVYRGLIVYKHSIKINPFVDENLFLKYVSYHTKCVVGHTTGGITVYHNKSCL